jgi:endonuclease/exonuclease/phosphatase (EEP) superfamily protein YafD
MARQPENPKSRGRRSEALDWLNELNEPDHQAPETPEVDRTSPLGQDGSRRPSRPAAPGPGSSPGLISGPAISGPPGAGPPVSGPTTLSRRAARARREAEESPRQGLRQSLRQGSPAPKSQVSPALNGFGHLPQKRLTQNDAAQTGSTADRTAPNGTTPNGTPPHAAEGLASHPSVVIRERERGTRSKEPGPQEQQPGPRRRKVATWLTIAALLLLLWSATAFIDSANVILTGLASLSLVVTVLSLPVIAIGVASKHLVPTAIAVAAALLPWTVVVGYAAAGPSSTRVGAFKTLRVMSVDGSQGRASAKDIVQVARVYSADVVVVTGLTSNLAHQLTVDGLPTLAQPRWVMIPENGVNGTGVWSGPAIDNLTPITELSRPGVAGAIESGTDQIGITVVQVDGDPLHPSSSWRTDLGRLADRPATTRRGFIVGDLNATPWQPAFRRLAGSGWRDAADVVGQGLRPTWPSWSPLPIVPLDHVLVNRGVGVTSADTTNITGSDHRALVVTLVVPDSGGD